MKSSPDTARFVAWLTPRSIVARTSIMILLLAAGTGLVFSMLASARVERAEHQRLIERVEELVSTVQSTASVACFLHDRTLAREIAGGLLKNRSIVGVRITSGPRTLYRINTGGRGAGSNRGVEVLSRSIYSPFDEKTLVGQVTLHVSHAEIGAQAAAYSRYAVWILSLQMFIVAAAVAFLVYFLVTRPIKGISDELHRIEIGSGTRLTLKPSGRTDEIGQLVGDVNSLIDKLTDVLDTERDLRHEHERNERRMRLIFEKADTGILVIDQHGVVQSCNPAFSRILGTAAGTGIALSQVLAPNFERVEDIIRVSLASGAPCDADLEVDLGGPRGKIWVELSVNPIGPDLLQGLVNDITERKRAESAAQALASHDMLTGVLNRRGVDHVFAKLNAQPRRGSDAAFAVLQIDLDYFKAVNDQHGHEAGDRVLREVARVLERCVRRSDIVARVGGDEFIVLLPGIGEAAKAQEIADAIIAGVQQPIDIGGVERAQIGASIGIAFASVAAEPVASLMRRADAAMYAAKQAGRGRACFAQPPRPDSADPSESEAAA